MALCASLLIRGAAENLV